MYPSILLKMILIGQTNNYGWAAYREARENGGDGEAKCVGRVVGRHTPLEQLERHVVHGHALLGGVLLKESAQRLQPPQLVFLDGAQVPAHLHRHLGAEVAAALARRRLGLFLLGAVQVREDPLVLVQRHIHLLPTVKKQQHNYLSTNLNPSHFLIINFSSKIQNQNCIFQTPVKINS